jgi:hypothetical protein
VTEPFTFGVSTCLAAEQEAEISVSWTAAPVNEMLLSFWVWGQVCVYLLNRKPCKPVTRWKLGGGKMPS